MLSEHSLDSIPYFLSFLQVECFACKEMGSTAPGGDIVVCSRRDCAKFFHEACIENLDGVTWGGPNEDLLVCPQHSCRACHHSMRVSKLHKCLLCPVAYHEQCAPEGSHLLEEIPSHCICWRHDSDWKRQPKVRTVVLNCQNRVLYLCSVWICCRVCECVCAVCGTEYERLDL